MVFMIHPDDAPEATVEGFRRPDGTDVARNPGEALSDLVARSCDGLRTGVAIFACYPPKPEPLPVVIEATSVDMPLEPTPSLFNRATSHWSEWRASQGE